MPGMELERRAPEAMQSCRLTSDRGCLAAALSAFTALVVIGGLWFVRKHFGPVSWDQVVFHLQQGGVEMADPKLLRRAARWTFATLAIGVTLTWLVLRVDRRWHLPFIAGLLAWAGYSVSATFKPGCQIGQEDLLGMAYVDPAAVRFEAPAPADRPDLLIVFVESLDEAYAGSQAFGSPLTPRLGNWRDLHGDLGELRNLTGASWTMGGLFTALCGLPLQSVGLVTRHSHEFASRFFGGTCLTDVLAAQGWELSFYGGASLDFTGKGRFFESHGVRHRFGRAEWAAAGVEIPAQGWGLLDSSLLEHAWSHMGRPRPSAAPRASILLTVGTHGPHGFADPGCRMVHLDQADEDPAKTMREALGCADKVVMDLVERFAAQADGRPKVVWVMGDHLSLPHPLTPQLQAAATKQPQTVFHAMARWDRSGMPLPPVRSQRIFTHVDVMPTLADALGLRWQPSSGRLGLGVSLLAPQAPATWAERLGFEDMDSRLSCPSPLFSRLWNRSPAPPAKRQAGTLI